MTETTTGTTTEAETPLTTPRLKTRYADEIRPALVSEFGFTNAMQVPGVVKVIVNMGVGEAARDAKLIDGAVRDLSAITGQKPVVTKARKSIAQFKLREGMPIGAHTTLRGDRMWEFLDRLVSVALPRIRDFRGLSSKQFDGRGNYTFGLTEQSMFHEIDQDKIDRVRGMDITVVTTAVTDDEDARCCVTSASRSRRTDRGKNRADQQGECQAEVQGSWLHPLPAVWPAPFGLPQVRPLPHLSSGDGPPRRAPGRHEEQLVTRINEYAAGRPVSQVETPVRKGGVAQ